MSNTPDKSADAGLGASLWASGSQVCMGARPIFVPYPTIIKTKPPFSHVGSRRVATAVSAEKETGASTLPTSIEIVIRTDPKSAMAIPTEQISTYFQVASREAEDRWV